MEKLKKETPYGRVNITKQAISKVVGDEVTSSYGVGGIVSNGKDKGKILSEDEYYKGIIISKEKNSYTIDIHLCILFPLKITEIINEVQKKVKYALQKVFSINFKSVNIYVEGLLIEKQ